MEWGHTVVDLDGPVCRCGNRGCLETYIGAEAILARYAAEPGSTPLASGGVEARLAELVARAVRHGEPAARTVLAATAEYLGVGVGNLINLAAPDRVIISGWAGALLCQAELLPAVRLAVRRHALPYLQELTRIEPGALGPSATALGAATLPVARLLADGGRRGDGCTRPPVRITGWAKPSGPRGRRRCSPTSTGSAAGSPRTRRCPG
jgi:predicted NBD/HSP70 family sugar kinase